MYNHFCPSQYWDGLIYFLSNFRNCRSELIFAPALQHYVVVEIIHCKEKNCFDSNMKQLGKSTLLRRFSKNSFAADVTKSKCLHAMSPNVFFCMHYMDNENYCSLITIRVLTRILKIGVKCCPPEKVGVLPYLSIENFQKAGVRNEKLE